MPRVSQTSRRRGQLKASLTKSLPLLHQRSIIRPPHHLPQGTLLRLLFPNSSNQVEYIALFRNQVLEMDNDMEPSPDNVPLLDTPDAETLF